MSNTYWHKQSGQPLYKELLWDKPENKQQAGKLLIIGGNAHSFTVPATAYQTATANGAGSVKVLLPDVLKKTIGNILENGEYAPSTKSGSFSKQALSEWLDFAAWADGVLLPGDMGRNSETAITLEKFADKYPGAITITHDALDYFINLPEKIIDRDPTTIVASFAQLQKIATSLRFPKPFTYSMPLAAMVEALHLFTTLYSAAIVIKHNDVLYCAKDGEVSTTPTKSDEPVWRVRTATYCAVWIMHNPTKIFAALSTAAYELTR